MAKPTTINKEQMVRDLQTVMYVVIHQFDRVYGGANTLALVNRQTGRKFYDSMARKPMMPARLISRTWKSPST